MPELPEVETVRRGLAPVLEGAVIDRVTLNRPDLRWPLPENMVARMEGQGIRTLRRRSKVVIAEMSGGESWLFHLGMSGRMDVTGAQIGTFYHEHRASAAHDHVVIDLKSGARLTYNDPRRFGAMDLWPSAEIEAHPWLAKLGPEPLGNSFHEGYLAERLAGRRSPIKAALLDQRIIAGLGNIYVCEALWRAGISPRRLAANLGSARIARLVPAIRDVLSEAITAGGSSLRDYRQADGQLGYFQHGFAVYDRENKPCPRCAAPIARIVQSGRSSFFCPSCQR
ncbi:bifunctional DNA-formamidopyrimidine glycosylase/DNA-(apurinic or apyrimidinic site) lyase [Paracoccaceae bacterium GXU_MW_L88]